MSVVLTVVLSLFLVYLAGNIISVTLYSHFKHHSSDPRKLVWCYRFRVHRIDVPPLHLSPYNDKTSPLHHSYLRYFGTVDDPVILQIAEDFDDMFKGKSEGYRAHCLQAMVQQNVTYESDIERFGRSEWCLPAVTLRDRKGDCMDSALLYASIAHNLGMDVSLAFRPDHALAAVFVRGVDYAPIELTGVVPVSSPWWVLEDCTLVPLYPPTREFLATLRPFSKGDLE